MSAWQTADAQVTIGKPVRRDGRSVRASEREEEGLKIEPANERFHAGIRSCKARKAVVKGGPMVPRSWPRLLRECLVLGSLVGMLPASTPAQSWKFVVFGDSLSLTSESGINTSILGELAEAIAQESPAFVLFGGDCAYLPLPANLSLWTNIMSPVYAAGIPVYPVAGNHDASDLAAFTNFFAPWLPTNGPMEDWGATYFVAYSNVLVLLLNDYIPGNEYRVNQTWIEAVLATNSRPHVIAAGHAPAFKLSHPDCLGSYPTQRDVFWNTLSNAHCRLYLSGHDHFYDHSRVDDGDGNPDNDLHQVIVGTGGAPFLGDGAYDGTNGIWTPTRVYHEAQYGYVTLTINGPVATTAWHYRAGANTFVTGPDVFTYSTSPRPRLTWTLSAAGLVLNWTGDGTLQTAPEPEGPFTDLPGAAPPYPVGETGSGQMFFRLRTKALTP